MFDEKEPGKPQDWGCTIAIIVIVCIFNISIFIVIRVILDSENEFNEPIIQGELRQLLTKFLGVFALSFCFGCYCCFCCMGNLFKWLTCCFHQQNRDNLVECWSSCMHHRQHVVEQMHKKSSTICKSFLVTSRRNKVSAHTTDEFEIAQIRRGISTDESSDHKPHVHFTLGEQNVRFFQHKEIKQ
ncbi:hypothetical protein M3Y97_00156300 [Aphelenchoides bicaudatus]|nr:hypothetical protein M3Y97_00156300 [Aphelenchoides bicaudatus]